MSVQRLSGVRALNLLDPAPEAPLDASRLP